MPSQFAEVLDGIRACDGAKKWVNGRDLRTCVEDSSCPLFESWASWLIDELYSSLMISDGFRRMWVNQVQDRGDIWYSKWLDMQMQYPGPENEKQRSIQCGKLNREEDRGLRAWLLEHLAELEEAIAKAAAVLS